jgi:AraC-like DNA-binding protein
MGERWFVQSDGDDDAGTDAATRDGLRAFTVAPPLRGHVCAILRYRETLPAGREVIERVVPDGAVRLVFNFAEAPRVGEEAGLPSEAIGAASQAALVRLRGRMDGLTVTLRAGAAAAVLGLPAGEISGTAVQLEDIWGSSAARLHERLAEAPSDATRVALLQDALLRRLARDGRSPHPAAAQAARLISASGGSRPLREVAASVNLGERRLQQLFHEHLGISPRNWRRLARLHACLRSLHRADPPRWADLAAATGYYDQAHLINEFRALCGVTPGEYLGQAVSGSSNTGG